MPKTIEYFMWPYQDLFRAVRNGAAERLFSQLSKGLDPELFVVGFLAEDRDDRQSTRQG